jgi:hypothetical protein
MWGMHQQGRYDDLDRAREPTVVGRRLDVGGFVLADPFELVLRQLSEPYLRDAWQRLEAALARWQVAPSDLSWGWLHPGETPLPALNHSAPSSFVGWSSQQLADFDHDARFPGLDAELRQGRPAIACACTWRSLKWRIAPDNVALGLRLVEALSTNEVTDWVPAFVVRGDRGPAGAWHAIASAILAEDQQALDRAVALARQTYSPVGYRIVLDGYASYLGQEGIQAMVTLASDRSGTLPEF